MTTTKKDKTKIVRKPMLVNLTEEQRAWLEGEAGFREESRINR